MVQTEDAVTPRFPPLLQPWLDRHLFWDERRRLIGHFDGYGSPNVHVGESASFPTYFS